MILIYGPPANFQIFDGDQVYSSYKSVVGLSWDTVVTVAASAVVTYNLSNSGIYVGTRGYSLQVLLAVFRVDGLHYS